MYILSIEISKRQKRKDVDPYIHIWARGREDYTFHIPLIGEIKSIKPAAQYIEVTFHNGEKITVDETYYMTFRNTIGGSATQNVQLYPVRNMWEWIKEYRKTREIVAS